MNEDQDIITEPLQPATAAVIEPNNLNQPDQIVETPVAHHEIRLDNTVGNTMWAMNGTAGLTTNRRVYTSFADNNIDINISNNGIIDPPIEEDKEIQEEFDFVGDEIMAQTAEGLPLRSVRCIKCGQRVSFVYDPSKTQWRSQEEHRNSFIVRKPEQMERELDLCRLTGEHLNQWQTMTHTFRIDNANDMPHNNNDMTAHLWHTTVQGDLTNG